MNSVNYQDKLKLIRNIYNIDQEVIGEEYILELLRNIASYLDMEYILVGRPMDKSAHIIRTDIAMAKGELVDNFEYDLEGTPCANVVTGKRVCIHSSDVFSDFPKDLLLRDMSVEAYVGAPIILPSGEFIGLLVLLDTKAFLEPEFLESAIDLFSSRIGVELAMVEANKRIEDLKSEVNRQVKEKEDIIKKSHKSLMEQEKLAALGRLTTGIAHEIRNPLNLVLNSSEIGLGLLEDIKKGNLEEVEDLGEALEIIFQHSSRMKNILSLMLDREKTESRQYVLEDLIEESFKFAFHASSIKDSGVKFSFERRLDSSVKEYSFSSDIQSVFINFFENSLYSLTKKYRDITGEATITVRSYDEGASLVFEVEDNGEGVSKEIVENIFEPFYTTKPGTEGSGMGLSIVKSIVQNNGGQISVDSKEGEFTKFKLSFPRS